MFRRSECVQSEECSELLYVPNGYAGMKLREKRNCAYPVKGLRVLGGRFHRVHDWQWNGAVEDRSKDANGDVIRMEEPIEDRKPEIG